MNYYTFEKTMFLYPVYSISDIEKHFPGFDNRRLVEWQHQGYIYKIRRGFYSFSLYTKDENFQFFAANKIYSPSYISLESALSYYNIIPEGVFTVMSVSSRNSSTFDTPCGNFTYRHLKKSLFFGYKLVRFQNNVFKIAEPEKALLDFLYFTRLNTHDEIDSLRINKGVFEDVIDLNKLALYQKLFNSKVLAKRVNSLNNIIYA